MKQLLFGAFLVFLLPLTAQEIRYQVTDVLDDRTIREMYTLEENTYVLVHSTVDETGELLFIEAATGSVIDIPKKLLYGSVQEVAAHPTQSIIAISATSKIERTKIIDLINQEVLGYLPILEKGNMAFSPDGHQFCMLEGKSIVLFNWKTGQEVNRLDMSSAGWIPYEFKFSPNGRFIACLASRYDEQIEARLQSVFLWDLSAGRLSQTYDAKAGHIIQSFGFTKQSGQLFLMEKFNDKDGDQAHRFIHWKKGDFINKFSKDLSAVEAYDCNPDGRYLAILEYSYGPLIIKNLETEEEKIYSFPTPLNFKNIEFAADGIQLLLMGETLTAFSMNNKGFQTLYQPEKFATIKQALIIDNGSTIILGDDNYAAPNITSVNFTDALVDPVTVTTASTEEFVKMEDFKTELPKVSSSVSNTPIYDDGACSPFKPFAVKSLKVTNKIEHKVTDTRQNTPYGLETVGFSQDEKMMVTYVPSNEEAGLYSSEMILWNVLSRCPIQQFENRSENEETYLILTQYANEVIVDQFGDQVVVRTDEDEFLFDIPSGELKSAGKVQTKRKNTLSATSGDGQTRAYYKRVDEKIVIEGKYNMAINQKGSELKTKVITWCYNDRILATVLESQDSDIEVLVFTDIRTKEQLEKIELVGNDITDLIWLTKRKRLVTIGREGTVQFWDISNLLPPELRPSSEPVESQEAIASVPEVDIDEFLIGSSTKYQEANDQNDYDIPAEPIILTTSENQSDDLTGVTSEIPKYQEEITQAEPAPVEPEPIEEITPEEPLVLEPEPEIPQEEIVQVEEVTFTPETKNEPEPKEETVSAEPLVMETEPETENLPLQTPEDEIFPGELTANDVVEGQESDLAQLLLNREFFKAERAAFELLYKNAADYDARVYLTLAYLFQGKYGKAKLTWYRHKDKVLTSGENFTDSLVATLDFLAQQNVSHRDLRQFRNMIQD